MLKRCRLLRSDELAPGQARQIVLDGHAPIAVFNVDGRFHAIDDTCTHGEASLAEGDVNGTEVICPFHYGAFDLTTGAPTAPPCERPVRVHPVHVEDGEVWIDLEP